MILTCPECATSYFVDDSRIPKAGRSVKCTSCGARWTAVKEAEPDAAAAPASSLPAAPPSPPEPFVPPVEDDLEVVAAAADADADAPIVAPIRPSALGETRGRVVVWAASAAVVAILIVGTILLRDQVVRLWPGSGAAFAGIGLPANGLGLVVEQVRAEPAFQGGRPVLAVTGAIRNIRDTAVTSPALRVNLLDRAGDAVAAKVVRPLDAQVPAHATRHFAVALVDPPASVHDLEVTFNTQPAKAAAPAARAEISPTPVEAKPLAPGSADALPQHD
jgi:predicted Zn finger-like uncharacterized protein